MLKAKEIVKKLIKAKDNAATILKQASNTSEKDSFFVSGGRVQFADNIKWCEMRQELLNKTIALLE